MDWQNVVAHVTRPRWLIAAMLVTLVVIGLGVALWTGSPLGPDASPTPKDSEGATINGTTEEDTAPLLSGTPLDQVGEIYRDADNDGLPDLLENYVYGSDPTQSYTRGGQVPDGWLAKYGYDPTEPGVESTWAAYPGPDEAPDAHGPHGLSPQYRMTLREVYLWDRPDGWNETQNGPWDNGLDPTTWDQGAGLPFTWLIHHGLDPSDEAVLDEVLDPTPDGDGLTVNRSYATATDPVATDTDGDGLDDDVELEETGTNPSRFATAGHGVADGWALDYGLDPTDSQMPLEDPDNDGLPTWREFAYSADRLGLNATLDGDGLDPTDLDSSSTGLPDGWLVREGLDPFQAGIADEVLQRSTDYGPAQARGIDEVTLTVEDAYTWARPSAWNEAVDGPWRGGLSAATNDTDGDGLPDAVEIAGWTVNVTTGTGTTQESQDRNVTSDPQRPDTDGDGLSDQAEFLGRLTIDGSVVTFDTTDPAGRDTDFDGLSDFDEVVEIPQRAAAAGVQGKTLDPANQDTDGDGLADGEEFQYWSRRAATYRSGATQYEFDHQQDDGVAILGQMPGGKLQGGVPTRESVAKGLEPWGDMDDDGAINILDPDADGDDLNDGWEIDPTAYSQSPFASEHPRPETDPANEDTDGDELPDGWEIRFGLWDFSLGNWNLNPATWDSFDDGTPDGDRDLDDDGTTWYTFHLTGTAYERKQHTFVATNLVEYEHGTDPNTRSTAGNGLHDGWTIFWGQVYPGLALAELGDVYPGAPGPLILPADQQRPSTTEDIDATTDETDRFRFSTEAEPRGDEILENVYNSVEDASTGEAKDVYQFREDVSFTYQDEQAHKTNPYLADTDADGAPDVWEVAYAGDGGTPSPVLHERDEDHDDDGLTLFEEYVARTDPLQRDTDRGGVDDGEETNPAASTDPLTPTDDIRLRDASVDTDGDGIADIDEVSGWEHPSLGQISTDPADPDTDGDGLLDGDSIDLDPSDDADQERIEAFGAHGLIGKPIDDQGTLRFLGETAWDGDPRAFSTLEDDIPDGWRAWWGLSSDGASADPSPFYTHARPPWWDESTMGPWWWGLVPDFDADVDGDATTDVDRVGNRFRLIDVDLDQDGLNDINGEDPTPAAWPTPEPPEGWPYASALSDEDRRTRGANFGLHPGERDDHADRDSDGDRVADVDDRLPATIEDTEIQGPIQGDTLGLQAGQPYTATGRVTVQDADGNTLPVPNATVAVHLWGPGHALGYAITDDQGLFEAPFSIQEHHTQDTAPPGIAFLYQTQPPVRWDTDLEGLEMGQGAPDRPNQLRLQVYNTSGSATPGDPTYLDVPALLPTTDGGDQRVQAAAIQGNVSQAIRFVLETNSSLTIQAPDAVDVGQPINLTLRLQDGTGQPIPQAPIMLNVSGQETSLTTDDQGQATHDLDQHTGAPGTLSIKATYPGDTFTLPTNTRIDVPVRHAADLLLEQAEPLPAEAGRPLTIAGSLTAQVATDDRTVTLHVPGATVNTTTGPSGLFNLTFDLPKDLPAGTTTLTASFAGDDLLSDAQADATLPAKAQPRIGLATVSNTTNLRPHTQAELLVSVTDGNGTPVPGQVTVKGLPGSPSPRNLTVGADGVASTLWTTGQTLGAHAVVASRPPDTSTVEAINQTWLTIEAPARLTADPPTLFRGRQASLTGSLEDVLGTPIPGGTVELHARNQTLQAATDADGAFRITWTVPRSAPLGILSATLDYHPGQGDPWEATTRELALSVRASALVEVTSHVLRAHPSLLVQVEMDTGEQVNTGTATLTIPDLNLRTTAPIQSGRAQFNLPLARNATPGIYDARIALQDIPDIQVPPAPVEVTIASPVNLDIDAPNHIGRGRTLDLHAVPTDDLGRPITAGTLTATLPDGTNASAPVDANLSLPIPPGTPTGPTPVTVEWTGPPGLLDATTTWTVDVRKATVITVDLPTTIEPGTRAEGTVRLVSEGGEPLADTQIVVREPTSDQATLLTTNETGHARLLVQPSSLGPTQLEFEYPGSQEQAREATTHTVTVATPTPSNGPGMALTLAGTLALLALAGVLLWAWRRRQLQEEVAKTLDEGARRVATGNEYRAAVLRTYYQLVDILADHGVVPEDTQTLREYETEIQTRLGVPHQHLTALFDVFDEVLYAPWTTGRDARRRARTAFLAVSRELYRHLQARRDDQPEEVTTPV